MTIAEDFAYDPIPVPGSGEYPDADTLRREIDSWVSSPAFKDLATAEGAAPSGTLAERLAYLDGFSAGAWDFRAMERRARAQKDADSTYIERNQVDREVVSGPRERQVKASARALGLVESRPPRLTTYRHVLVLGGLVRANIWRSAYAARLLRSGVISAPTVTGLTAFRNLARNDKDPTQDEPHLLNAFEFPQRSTEAAVMEDALAKAFNLPGLVTRREDSDGEGRFRVAEGVCDGVSVTLVAAPDPTSTKRADTATTMRYWASEVAHVEPGDTILFVTSSIYVPFQHAVAVQNLGLKFGARVETVGVNHQVIDPAPLPQEFRGVNYLQEIRSAVVAYRRLLNMLDDDS